MPSTDSIIKNYVEFFRAGAKDPADLKHGLEAEHFIVYKDTKKAVPYLGENGVCALLHELSPHFDREYVDDGHLLGLLSDAAELSLEPGSQLEISTAASASIAEMAATYEKIRTLIDPILESKGQELVSIGYQPATLAAEIELLPKTRYRYMDTHFKQAGTHGINMMRATASCQVVLDYVDEADFIEKYRAACILLPLLSLFAANSPVFEGEKNDNPLIRTVIWRGVDPARSCLVPSTFDEDFSFAAYAAYIINQAAIFEMKNEAAKKSARSVRAVLAKKDALITWDEDYLLYLSLVFPDVRLRQYIEIRIADAMPTEKSFAYVALIKGLFSDMAALRAWLKPFPRSISAITAAQDAIMQEGLNALVYGESAARLLKQMRMLAEAGLTPEERIFLQSKA